MNPDIPRKAYFPSAVAGMPRAFFGEGIGSHTNTYVSNTPFHEEQMRDARKRVADRFRVNGYNNNNYLIGGVRNMLPKPQPQGSFAMPLNLNGNQTYPTVGYIRGGGGSFRTDAGAAYGQQLLKQRAEQLRQLQAVVEQGAAVPSVPAPAEAERMEPDEADEVAFTLLMDDLSSAITASVAQYGSMRGNTTASLFGGTTADDFRRLFGLARKIVLDLPRNSLVGYIDRMEDLIDTFAKAIESSELPNLIDEEVDLVGATRARTAALRRILPLYKTLELLRMGLASINLQEKPRKMAMKQFVKQIAGAGSVAALEARVDRMEARLQERLDADADEAYQQMYGANEQAEEDEEAQGIGAAEAAEDEQVAAGMAVVAPPEEEEAGEQDELLRQLGVLQEQIDYLFTDFQGDVSNEARRALSALGRLVNGIVSNPARISNRTVGLMGSLSETLNSVADEEDDNTLELELRSVAQMADDISQLMRNSLQGSGYGMRGKGKAKGMSKARTKGKILSLVSSLECHSKAKGKKRGGAMNELDMKIEQVGKMNDKARKTHQQDLAYGKGGRVTTKSYSSERTNTGMNNQRFSKQRGSNVSMVITQ